MTSSGPVILGSYEYSLVSLSVFISVFAAYAALELADRVTAARGRARLAWLIGGATASGIGTWSTHYSGMLTFSLPVPAEYDWRKVLLSFLPALVASAAGLCLVSRQNAGGAT